MTALLALIGPKVIVVMVAILAALGWGFQQRLAGAKAERRKQAASEAKAKTVSDEIDDAIAGRSPDANRKEISKWTPR